MLYLKHIVAIYLAYYIYSCNLAASEKITFFALERPIVQYTNPKFVSFANMSSRRHNRQDPVHYFSLFFRLVQPLGNNFTWHFYFYELLTNVYKPSFVELHVKTCNLIEKDPVFGPAARRALSKTRPNYTCPLSPGDWYFPDVMVSCASMPNFPFINGRIYLNVTFNQNGERVAGGYVDFQVKQINGKTRH